MPGPPGALRAPGCAGHCADLARLRLAPSPERRIAVLASVVHASRRASPLRLALLAWMNGSLILPAYPLGL